MFFKEEYKPFLTSRKNRPFLPALYLYELTALPINYPSGQGREVMSVLGTFFFFWGRSPPSHSCLIQSLRILPSPSSPYFSHFPLLCPLNPPYPSLAFTGTKLRMRGRSMQRTEQTNGVKASFRSGGIKIQTENLSDHLINLFCHRLAYNFQHNSLKDLPNPCWSQSE